MTAQLLDGKTTAAQIRAEIAAEVKAWAASKGRAPAMAVVRAGSDPASVSYAKMIGRTAEQVGITCTANILPETASEADIIALVRSLSTDKACDGIIIQEPLPKGVQREAVIAVLDPAKDVDGVHPYNAGRLMQGAGDYLAPATPSGGMELLARFGIALKGRRAVVVGRSNVVGRPMALMLMHQNATVTVCHSRTTDLAAECLRAEILVAATGKAGLINGDMVAPGAVVVDFGVNYANGKMVGDVDFNAAAERAAWITPVPGGTGPMTNVVLMKNVLRAANAQA